MKREKKTSKSGKELGLFVKGTDPRRNLNGRPKKADTFADIAREMLASTKIELTLTKPDGRKSDLSLTASNTFNHALSVSLIKHGMAGNVAAVKELLDRVNGKVSDKLMIEDNIPSRVVFIERSEQGDKPI